MRGHTNVTMKDVIRNSASMDAEREEEKQRMQAHFAQLSRNAQEEKQIAIARINPKLHPRDNGISELQEIRDKYDKMLRENSVSQQPSELVTPPVGRPAGILPTGI